MKTKNNDTCETCFWGTPETRRIYGKEIEVSVCECDGRAKRKSATCSKYRGFAQVRSECLSDNRRPVFVDTLDAIDKLAAMGFRCY